MQSTAIVTTVAPVPRLAINIEVGNGDWSQWHAFALDGVRRQAVAEMGATSEWRRRTQRRERLGRQ